MEISKKQAGFLNVARGKNKDRPALLNIWTDPKHQIMASADGFRLHAISKPCTENFDFRTMQIDDQVHISLQPEIDASKPDLDKVNPKRRVASMYINRNMLATTLKSLMDREDETIKITIADDGPNTDKYYSTDRLEITGTCDGDSFYALIMGINRGTVSKDDWTPFQQANLIKTDEK